MRIHFETFAELQQRIHKAASRLKDINDSIETRLKGGNVKFKRDGFNITVSEDELKKHPDIVGVLQEFDKLYNDVLKDAGITEE